MIKISLTVELEAADLAALGSQWAALLAHAVTPALRSQPVPSTSSGTAKATERPVLRKTPVLVANPPAPQPSPEFAAIAPATPAPEGGPSGNEGPAKRNTRLMPTLPWDEYDKLVRREMKRLSLDKRLPGRKLWDEQRDRRLPTLDAVRMRYKCSTLAQLAEELGLSPPLHGGATVVEMADS